VSPLDRSASNPKIQSFSSSVRWQRLWEGSATLLQPMEIALWRWSVAVQLTSVAMITLFFGVLQRSVRREDLRDWSRGWIFNFTALAVALFFWVVQPPGALYWWVRLFFLSLKTLAALFMMQGAWALAHPGGRLPRWRLLLVVGGLLYPFVGAFFLDTNDRIGLIEQTGYGVVFLITALFLLRSGERGLTWLASGLIARGVLCVGEGVAYALALVPAAAVAPRFKGWGAAFLSASSSFDSGTEWLLALGFVLALSNRLQRELQRYNLELLTAQEELRRLADRDPLTALPNRRSLPEIFRSVHERGAQVVFFDLDDFKRINDVYGHQAGDEYLKRFAAALRESFRPHDALVRYAGDEFLVVAAGMDAPNAHARIAALRNRLEADTESEEIVRFSAGVADLPAGGDAARALREADEAMYAAKAWSADRRQRA
jgi:diguanylate cyclase (GGDEF)-like protein